MSDGNDNMILLLGRLDGKMDTLLLQQTNHDQRIRELEKGRWFNLGVSGTIGGLVSAAIALMGALPK